MGTSVTLLGAGGLARECWEILRVEPSISTPLSGCFADPCPEREDWSSTIAGELGTLENFFNAPERVSHSPCVIAIGDIPTRGSLASRILDLGGALHTTLAARADIGSTCSIGDGCIVLAMVTLTANVHVGRGTLINPQSSLSHDVRVGDFCNIGPAATLCGHVTVGNGCDIGAAAVILPRVTVGDGSVIGAGAVVTEDVPPGVTVSGVPARPHH